MLLNNGLSPKAVKAIESEVRELTISLIEDLKDRGHCDFIADFSEKLPIQIFMKIMNLPFERWRELKSLADQITRPDGSLTYHEAEEAMYEFLSPYIDERRGGSGTDLISGIVNGEVKGEPLTREDCLNFVTMVTIAGLDTLVNFLGFVMHHLATHPDQQRDLAQNPERIQLALEELLRRFPLVVVSRYITRDMEYHGAHLKQGEMITIPSPMHGLDPEVNKCPLDVNFDREVCAHTAFGSGPHKCAGAFLARMEVCITLEEWFKRIPEFELSQNAHISYKGGLVATIDNVPLVWSV
jgi:cytochrome P450